MEYYSAIKRNAFESVLMRWMNVEPIIQSEVRKRKINSVFQLIYMESRKMVLRIYLQGYNGETDIENRLMDMGRGKERVRCMERITCKLILPYVK